jgi:hypothetical protein
VDVLVNNTDGGEHPMHLHGHNFWVIATSDYPEAEDIYGGYYLKRDIVSVPAKGWAKFRFVAKNPGVWSLHCHIDWHMALGLFANIIEAPDQLRMIGKKLLDSMPSSQLTACQLANHVRQLKDDESSSPTNMFKKVKDSILSSVRYLMKSHQWLN